MAPSAPLLELAERWLAQKSAGESSVQARKGNSDRARRADLCRWGQVLKSPDANRTIVDRSRRLPTLDLAVDLAGLTTADLDGVNLTAAVARARARWSDATVVRMTSTLRGLIAWSVRRGQLAADPFDEERDVLKIPDRPDHREVHALSDSGYDDLLAAAAVDPPAGTRQFWPERDLAIVQFLASTGARAEELCGARLSHFDTVSERVTIWSVDTSKGSMKREVMIPAATWTAIDTWNRVRGPHSPTDPLFTRRNGLAMTPSVLNHLLKALATRAGVELPAGAAAHSFRHRYGTVRADRGVQDHVLAELMGHRDPRTTRIYTKPSRAKLISALDEAGLL